MSELSLGYITSVLISDAYIHRRQLDKTDNVFTESAEVLYIQPKCYLLPLPAIAPVSEQEHRAT